MHLSSLSTPILGPSCPVVELNLVFILTAISFRRVLFCICSMYILVNYPLYPSICISGGPWQLYSDLNSLTISSNDFTDFRPRYPNSDNASLLSNYVRFFILHSVMTCILRVSTLHYKPVLLPLLCCLLSSGSTTVL